MAAMLTPLNPGYPPISLEKAIILVGRQSDCDIVLNDSRKISRRHCCIVQVNNDLMVRDLGSTNGVTLNGKRVRKEAKLAIGDELIIGDVPYRLEIIRAVERAAKSPQQISNTGTKDAPVQN